MHTRTRTDNKLSGHCEREWLEVDGDGGGGHHYARTRFLPARAS